MSSLVEWALRVIASPLGLLRGRNAHAVRPRTLYRVGKIASKVRASPRPRVGDFARPTSRGSIERTARQRGKLAAHPIGYLAGDRQAAVALEMLDREPRVGVIDAGRLDLAITEFAQRPLDRQ